MKIRSIEPERDADDIVELIRATRPLQLTNREVWLHRVRSVPERLKLFSVVAEIDDKVVGEASTGYMVEYSAQRERLLRQGGEDL